MTPETGTGLPAGLAGQLQPLGHVLAGLAEAVHGTCSQQSVTCTVVRGSLPSRQALIGATAAATRRSTSLSNSWRVTVEQEDEQEEEKKDKEKEEEKQHVYVWVHPRPERG